MYITTIIFANYVVSTLANIITINGISLSDYEVFHRNKY